MKTLKVIVLLCPLVLTGCIGPGRPPHAVLPPIAEEYHVCGKCGSLHGGIYGKGPLASFSTDQGASCWHRWSLITKTEFQRKAAEQFPGEWAKAGHFFKGPPSRLSISP